ncbi:MAG: lipoate protein ligase C-terminal domain-containing protein [Candidatus Hadarchaeales archaeon]
MEVVGRADFKAPKGLIRVEVGIEENRISRVSITGDFFMYPEEALFELERELIGVAVEREAVREAVRRFYGRTGAKTPMVDVEHWVEAVMRAAGSHED